MKSSFDTTVADKTMVDLFLELDSIPWYYKFMSSVANWAMLAGFIVFPNAFNDDKSKFKVDTDTIRIIAVCLLVFGYLLTGLLCWRFRNLLFQVESIFTPGFSSSTIGLMSSLFSVYGRIYDSEEEQWSASAICAITVSGVFMILYGTTTLNGNRKLDAIRKLDECKRQIALSQEDENLLPEEERTRRNLLGLLLTPQQLSAQQSQYQRGFGTVGLTSSTQRPTTTATYSQASFNSTAYPPINPVSILSGVGSSSPHSSVYLSNYGHTSTHLSETSAERNSGDLADGNKEGPLSPRSGYSALSGGSGRSHNSDQELDGQQPSVGRRNSIFAGISATVGRGRERIGAGWNTWSAV